MKRIALLVLVLLLTAMPAFGKTVIDLSGTWLQPEFKKFSTELGLALSYVPLAPAEPLGTTLLPGFDIGVEITSVDIKEKESYWSSKVGSDVPSMLLFPKLHVQVGLPVVPIDFGYVYAKVPDSDIKLTGGEIKWAILRGSTVTPALAIRGAYTKLSGVDVLDLDTKSVDISISKGFAMLTPYAGVAQVWITSKENDPDVILSKEDISETKAFVGLKMSLLPVFNIVAEADFATVNMYSLRLNLSF
jgi:hypothetical protein